VNDELQRNWKGKTTVQSNVQSCNIVSKFREFDFMPTSSIGTAEVKNDSIAVFQFFVYFMTVSQL
jgi:hypothetical protein